jgi:hypothetical protein
VHDAPLDLDHEQDVVAPEGDRVDGEEVGGQDALGLGLEELAPRRPRATWSRRKAVSAQDRGDARLDTVTPSFFSSPTMRR